MFEYMAGAEERAGSIAKLYLQASRYFAGKMDTIFERYQKQNRAERSGCKAAAEPDQNAGRYRRIKTAVAAGDGGREQQRKQLLGSWKLRHTGRDWNGCSGCMAIWIMLCRAFISRSRSSTKHGI